MTESSKKLMKKLQKMEKNSIINMRAYRKYTIYKKIGKSEVINNGVFIYY